MQHLFEVAKNEWELPIKDNYIKQVRFKAETNRRERRLRPGELERIVKAARACRNPLVLPIILFALETALRRSEILAARWSHLQLNNRLLALPRAKNGHSRVIPLTLSALQILERLQLEIRTNKMDDGGIFPLSANGFKLAWKRVLRRAKIEGLRFHDLRHEAISRFFEFGLTTPEVASISGHRDMRMLFRYAHAEKKNAIGAIGCSRKAEPEVDRPLNPNRVPVSRVSQELIAEATRRLLEHEVNHQPRQRRRKAKDQEIFEARSVETILSDVICSCLLEPNDWLYLSLSHNQSRKQSRYEPFRFGQALGHILNIMEAPEIGFIERMRGKPWFQDADGEQIQVRRLTTIRATQRLKS